ncbi:MAG: hypothetical protein PVH36_13115, partial [Desulfobacterales bacterium]
SSATRILNGFILGSSLLTSIFEIMPIKFVLSKIKTRPMVIGLNIRDYRNVKIERLRKKQ